HQNVQDIVQQLVRAFKALPQTQKQAFIRLAQTQTTPPPPPPQEKPRVRVRATGQRVSTPEPVTKETQNLRAITDARQALLNLGYKTREAEAMLDQASGETTEELVRSALRNRELSRTRRETLARERLARVIAEDRSAWESVL